MYKEVIDVKVIAFLKSRHMQESRNLPHLHTEDLHKRVQVNRRHRIKKHKYCNDTTYKNLTCKMNKDMQDVISATFCYLFDSTYVWSGFMCKGEKELGP